MTQNENFKITLNFKPHLDDNINMNQPTRRLAVLVLREEGYAISAIARLTGLSHKEVLTEVLDSMEQPKSLYHVLEDLDSK